MLKNVEKLLNYTGNDIVYQAGNDFVVQPGGGLQDFIYNGNILAKVNWRRGEFVLIPDNGLSAAMRRRRKEYKAYFIKKSMTEIIR